MSELALEQDQALVVGIGASAGGLEALQSFFSSCPDNTGACFVVVQHLSPDFKSMMDQLLSRCTNMPVKMAEDGEQVHPNHVYLIPPRKSMIIAEGALILTDAAPHVTLSLPIDTFFRSLAEDQQHLSVGIILSGTGSDGSRGIAGIKEVGGLVLVQEPGEAKFDGMPNAAISSNYVDHVFPVEKMPDYLVGYKRSLYRLVASNDDEDIGEVKAAGTVLEDICATVQKHVNINLRDYKRSTIARRIDKRASLHQLTNWADYLAFLKDHPEEQSLLGKEILIGVTSFFRDPEVFENLQNEVIPKILNATPQGEEVRVWSAGCSTGEEAYSIAITFEEAMIATGIHRPLKVFATDIDANAVHEASQAKFAAHISEEIPNEILSKYFSEHDGGYEVKTPVRQKVVFAVHNVISDPPFSNMDLVMCRNLLIYLGTESQNKVQHYLNFALRKDRYLVLGPSESLIPDLSSNYKVLDRRYKQFLKVNVERKLISASAAPRSLESGRVVAASMASDAAARSHANRDGLLPVFRELSESFSPATLVFNSRQEVVYSIGNCEPFTRKMSPGPSSLKVDAVLDQSLVVAVTTAMQKAKREKQAVTYLGVALPDDGVVDLSVRYAGDTHSAEEFLLVSFTNSDSPREIATTPIQFDEKQMLNSRVEDLEAELQQTRSNLAVTVEELETSNEELQSTNEELMAANEELQSTNEELQSVNEELFSVNSEYQHKVQLLEETTVDFENLIKNPSVSLLALDSALVVKHFSPSVTEYIKLRSSDLDRSISDISHSLGENFVADCARVMETRQETTLEYRADKEKLLLARFTPRVDIRDHVNGVVISFTDVGDSQIIKREKDSLTHARVVLERQKGHLMEMLHPLRHDGESHELRALIVEDDETDLTLLVSFLKDSKLFNLRYEHCFDLASARAVFDSGSFDVVLLDFNLGGEDASAALSQNMFENVPIILLSGMPRDAFANVKTSNVYDYFDKADLSTALLEKSLHLTLQSHYLDDFLNPGT